MRRLLTISLTATWLWVGQSFAAVELIKAPVLSLRPTQIAVGMIEVGMRSDRLQKMDHPELERYLANHVIPVVLGPQNWLYIIDHHHLVRAAWEQGIRKLPIETKADLSSLPPANFWDAMRKAHWLYPYDQYGDGPHDPSVFPIDVRGLADDPYRSLSWRVRRKGGYEKVDIPFVEFKWAEFFRRNLKIQSLNDNFDAAVQEALELAKSPAAAELPGYIGASER